MKFSKKGDKGETSLLGGQRVPKFDPRPDTYGTLDEASSALGVQKDLLTLGAVLSTLPEDLAKLNIRIGEPDVSRIEALIDDLQKNVTLKNEFIYPGETVISAQIDVGRTIIRRAERKAAKLKADGLLDNEYVHQYLNRLADMLFTLARYEEQNG
jgi:cob(I)alamin adenosyltransferase